MKILSWNVNGIRAVYKKGLMEWLQNEKADIFCFQEIKAAKEQVPPEIIEKNGYHSYFSEAEKKGYSGVAAFTRREPVQVEYGLGVPRFDSEGRTLLLYFDDFILYNIYFPNGKASKERLDYKMDFYDAFLTHASEKMKDGHNIVICGDVNTAHTEIDLARPKANENTSGFLPEEREWIDRFISQGFIDTFRLFNSEAGNYSWWDYKTRARERNVGWRIDYFFVSNSLRDSVTDAFIQDHVMGSDHCPVGIELKGN
ncbi:MAG: exodeoxyribonuclease III [Spirochaetota bacterium]